MGTTGRQGAEESGVFVRRDLEDESGEVDISMGDVAPRRNGTESERASSSGHGMALVGPVESGTKGPRTSGRRITLKVKQEVSAMVPPPSKSRSNTTTITATSRTKRRPSPPLSQHDTRPSKRSKAKASSSIPISMSMSAPTPTSALSDTDASEGEDAQDVDGAGEGMVVTGDAKNKTKNGKPRNETYKQAWSVEEQHHLERLLQEIPDGEKNRWVFLSFHISQCLCCRC